ncbi:MAG: hypothetical protein ACREIA_13335 [Opitutaceae bacterium]
MKPILFLLVVASILFAGCRSPEAIYQSSGVAVPDRLQPMEPRELANIIVQDPVIVSRGWYLVEVMDDRVRLGLTVRAHEAIVDVSANDGNVRLALVSSENLEQENGKIHPFFNSWMENFERDLRRALLMKSGESTFQMTTK